MHSDVDFISLNVLVMVFALVAFICAYRIASKKCDENCQINCNHNGSNQLVIYLLIGSLCFITGFKLQLDQWITTFF